MANPASSTKALIASIAKGAIVPAGIAARQGLRAFVTRMQRLLLPQSCTLCGLELADDGPDEPVCGACAATLLRHEGPRCPCCALPTPCGEVCGVCLRRPPAFDDSEAPFIYAFPVDRLVHSLKYRHQLALAPWFGARMAAHWLAQERPCPDVIVPMPLHPARLAARGFNQALEIAHTVAHRLGEGGRCVPVVSAEVERLRAAPPQASLPWKLRHKNMKNAFLCHRDLSGAYVLLLDDVMTTGASVHELALCLKNRGAARVSCLVLARTVPHNPAPMEKSRIYLENS